MYYYNNCQTLLGISWPNRVFQVASRDVGGCKDDDDAAEATYSLDSTI